MALHEKFMVVFFMTLLIGGGYLMYQALGNRTECVKMALSQNYSADHIKKICR